MIESGSWSAVTLHSGDTGRVLNTRACPGPSQDGDYGTLPFVFEFEGGEARYGYGPAGEVRVGGGREDVFSLSQSFSSTPVAGKVTGINGVYMTYNC